jgi:2'-5' RNA ligase
LPEEIKRQLAKYQEKWPELPAKWTAKDNLHITLEFLGDLTDVEVGEVCQIVNEVAKRNKSFDIVLNDLQECLLEKVAFRPEPAKGFILHITLARISEWAFRQIEPEERPEINEDIDLTFTVESIEVMESVLKRTGPVYTVLESHQLK